MSVRQAIKGTVFGLAAGLMALPALLCYLEKRLYGGDLVFLLFGQSLAVVPGYPGVQLRAAFHALTLEQCAWQVHIGFGTLFMHRGARVAQRVSTGAYCVLGHVTLGEGVRLASRVSIPSGKRQHLDEHGRLSDTNQFDRVSVGAGAWVGEGAILLADVGSGSIVSAGAVVVNALPAQCLAGGNPARVLRELPAASAQGTA
jgi:acetyltransferase-like isoleucine patch superfamily enzyme